MNMNERNDIRELTLAKIEAVAGALSCANGQHLKDAQISIRKSGTPSGWWGTNEAAG